MQSAFPYDAATIASLESALSIDRFSSYPTAAAGDRRRAIALYEWNSRTAFYVPLQAVEVGCATPVTGNYAICSDPLGTTSRPSSVSIGVSRYEFARMMHSGVLGMLSSKTRMALLLV